MKIIFVFGSNLNGIHGKGSALYAKKFYGAKDGLGFGYFGDSYAIPTRRILRGEFFNLLLNEIEEYINEFIRFAKIRKDLEFHIVDIGCGNAGYKIEQIAPLFKLAPKNCIFIGNIKDMLV